MGADRLVDDTTKILFFVSEPCRPRLLVYEGFRLIMFASGEKTDETAPGTEPPRSGWASDEKERIVLSRAARGAGSHVDGAHVDTHESTTGPDPNADGTDHLADNAGDHSDDADLDFDADFDADLDLDLDLVKYVYVHGNQPQVPPADDADVDCDTDIPAPDLDVDDTDSERYVDEPDAEPGRGGPTDKSVGVSRSSQQSSR
jgi:hypothetical protein